MSDPPEFSMVMKLVSKYVYQQANFWQRKGQKIYSLLNKGHKNITVIFTFSADGKTCCPVILYPYKRIPEKISRVSACGMGYCLEWRWVDDG
jgi:hypothetical protein